jgi:hypothetical protein
MRRKKGEPFIRGPLPTGWFRRAAQLPGKALAVGLAIWFESGRRKSDRIKLTRGVTTEFGLERRVVYRGLAALESAGLVSTDRHPGKAPLVTIVDLHTADEELD